MQRFTKLLLVWLLIGLLPNGSASAQSRSQAQATERGLLGQLQQQTGGQLRIERHAETGKVRFLAAAPGQPIPHARSLAANATPEQAARSFLGSYGALFGLRSQADELMAMRDLTVGDRSFVRFQQRYHGVPVLGGELVVQSDGQRNVVTANGEALPDITIDTTPRLSAQQAQDQARATVAKSYKLPADQLSVSQPQLSIFNPALLGGPGLRLTHLTWRVEVQARTAGTAVREMVLVDAYTGRVTLHFNQITEAKKRYICDDNNAPDADQDETNNCPPSKYVRTEGGPVSAVTDVDLAYDYSGATYDYYKEKFGRDSIDGNGMPLISLVRYCPGSCPFYNAFWDGQQMTYGDGFASGDDVVGHELTHGVTEHTSGLFYYYQSGAINESMSDVFGELIDMDDGLGNDATNERWLLGEDLPSSIGIIRNMADPPNVPGHIGDTNYQSPDRIGSQYYYSDTQDNGGVHINSGVNNKAAFLMADGGAFNGYTIRGLGLDKMGQIYYRTNSAFLTSGSDYQDLADDLQAACQSLIGGTAGITKDDCAEVTKVVKATEMDQQPANASTPEAATCPPGKYPNDIFYDNLENTASGAWASAPVGATTINTWYYPQQNAPAELLDALGGDSYATSGTGNFWGYDQGENDFSKDGTPGDYAIAMTHDVAVPANAFFHFRHAYDFEADGYSNYDGGVVEYSADGGATWKDAGTLFDKNGYNGDLPQESDPATDNPLHDRSAFTGVSYGYTSSRADLSTLAGKNIRFRFRIGTDGYGDWYGWFIDDIRMYTCSDTPPATQSTVAFSSSSMRVNEDAGIAQLPVALSTATPVTVTVNYSVTGGTAVAGTDFALEDDALVFPPNTTAQTIPVMVINNPDSSADRTVVITLRNPQQASLGTATTITLTIVNKDSFEPKDPAIRTYLPLLSR